MTSRTKKILRDRNGGKNHVLPPYIDSGTLDASRARIQRPRDKNGETILNASYVTSKGELVYEVRLEKESCYVEEFFEGRVIGGTKSAP